MVEAGDPSDVIVSQDLPQAIQLLSEMNEQIERVTQLVDRMLIRVRNGELSTANGLSFLEVMYQTLLSYMINITHYVLLKSSGKQIENDPAIDRLIELRTVLEKLRPLDQKLHYQVQKLVNTAVTGSVDTSKTLSANTQHLASKFNDSDDDMEGNEKGSAASAKKEKGIYVPPKLAAAHYNEQLTTRERKQLLQERARRRSLNSTMLQEMREQYLDTPLEVHESNDTYRMRVSKAAREREEYEEEHMTRLPVSKQERHSMKRLSTLGSLGNELTNFGGMSDLLGEDGGPGPSKKKRFGKGGRKKKGSFKKWKK